MATNWPARPIDGIRDYSVKLTSALAETGADAFLLGRTRRDGWSRDGSGPCVTLEEAAAGVDALLLQYNPFNFGRYGFAPWLPRTLARIRRRAGRPLIGATVHEREIYPVTTRRAALMAAWQRRQLQLCWPSLDLAFACVGVIAQELSAARPSRPVTHLPVGSNLPDARAERAAARSELGADDDGTLVVAAFGTDHPSRRSAHLRAAVGALARETDRLVVLNLGARAPALEGLPAGVEERRPGEQPAHAIARSLASADLFLAPFSDGVSTRRTTVMAALQHGLPVVGTRGVWTDDLLLAEGLVLVAADDVASFGAAAAGLATDAARRTAAAAAARRLYEREFAWPVIARRVRERLEAHA